MSEMWQGIFQSIVFGTTHCYTQQGQSGETDLRVHRLWQTNETFKSPVGAYAFA